MAGSVVTAAEPVEVIAADRDAVLDRSVVTHLDEVPAEFLAQVRHRLERHIDRTESAQNQK